MCEVGVIISGADLPDDIRKRLFTGSVRYDMSVSDYLSRAVRNTVPPLKVRGRFKADRKKALRQK